MAMFGKIVRKFCDICMSLFVALVQAGIILFGFNYTFVLLTGNPAYPEGAHILTVLTTILLVLLLLMKDHKIKY